MLEADSDLLDAIQAVMVSLRTLKSRAALREHTPLAPAMRNATRWSSTQAMLTRYLKIKDVITEIVDPSIQLSPVANKRAAALSAKMRDLDVLGKELQSQGLHMCVVRDLFDAGIERFPQLGTHCAATSDIVSDPDFESTVVALQRAQLQGAEVQLNDAQEQAVANLLKPDAVDEDGGAEEKEEDLEDTSFSAAIKRIKGQRFNRGAREGAKYLDLRFIRPTTNRCERSFSKSGWAYNSRRQNMLPVSLEQQLFLHFNQDHWDRQLFVRALKLHV